MVGERSENIPYMNIAWFIPAIIGSILTATKVKVSPFPNQSEKKVRKRTKTALVFRQITPQLLLV